MPKLQLHTPRLHKIQPRKLQLYKTQLHKLHKRHNLHKLSLMLPKAIRHQFFTQPYL